MENVIGSVIVPLDGSTLAEAALPVGQSLASRSGKPLHLVRVIDRDAPAETERQAQQELEDAAQRVDLSAKLHLRLGDPADQILTAVANLPHPLIVMTTHGRTGLGRWAFGSVADRVVHGGEAPVLLLHSGATPPSTEFRRILVPLDGSALAEVALPEAFAVTRLFEAELHLLRVAEPARIFMTVGYGGVPIPAPVINQVVADLEARAVRYLEQVVAMSRDEGLIVTSAVRSGIPAETVLAYVDAQEVDLVVMATHGRSGFNRLVLGSVAERLLRLLPTPLLMVPVAAAEELQELIQESASSS